MRRRVALGAEILAGRYDADSEVRLPHAIHDGARRRGGIPRCQPARKSQARGLAILPGIVLRKRMQERRDAGFHQLGRLQEIAACQDVRFPQLSAGCEHQLRGPFGIPSPDFGNLIVFRFPFRNRSAPIAENRLHLKRSALAGRNGEDVAHVLGHRISRGARCVGNGQAELADIIALVVAAVPPAMILRQVNGQDCALGKGNGRRQGENRFPGLIAQARTGVNPPRRFILAVNRKFRPDRLLGACRSGHRRWVRAA